MSYLQCLLAIPHHPNIIPLYDAFLMPVSKELHFVFECMEGNLYQLTKSRRGRSLAGGLVASIFQQIVKGLHHIHLQGYFHRDMKPENLLITTTGLADYPSSSPTSAAIEKDVLVIVKLADFGLARETNSKPPYTEYVSTRWYRAPEVLLRSRDYSNPVDMWALGTILAELVNLKPLFPGQSEVDQVMQICEILGDPVKDYGRDDRGRQQGGGEWSRGLRMAKNVGFTFPNVSHEKKGKVTRKRWLLTKIFYYWQSPPVNFSALFSSKVPVSLIDCIQDLLRYDPNARMTTEDCLNCAYYQNVAPRLQPPQAKAVVSVTTREEQQAALAKTNVNKLAINSIANGLDQSAQRSALPPSHSMMSQSSKPAFGDHHPIDADVPMDAVSPGIEESGITKWAPAPGGPARDSSVSHYPAFPDSASLFAGSHASTQFGERSVPSPQVDYAASMMKGNALRGVNDEDLEMMQAQEQQQMDYSRRLQPPPHPEQHQQHPAYSNLNYDHGHLMYRHGKPDVQGTAASMVESSSGDNLESANNSGELIAIKERDKRKSKGSWISSVLGGGSSSTTQGSGQAARQQQQQNTLAPNSGTSTPAQRLAAEHSERLPEAPVDAKKAKKMAEKAAREAEKAKRVAQDKAARDRARAVMQKRNQILASSNTREQVEWLNMAENDSTRALQSSLPLSSIPSEVSRGKQPIVKPLASVDQFGPYQPYASQGSTSLGSPAWQSQRSSSRGQIRRRDYDEGGYYNIARRQSIQSFQTGDSDPGPIRTKVPGSTGLQTMHNHESTSSLNSAPGLMDGTFSTRNIYNNGDRNSFDTRSMTSSLDHQLIQNMENMTAADSVRHRAGSTSPGPVHLVGQRPSYSRQSHGSRTSSAHRQGSASPLHHQAAPRFHPYTVSSSGINGNNIPQPTSAQSSYNFHLPSLATIAQNQDYLENLQSSSGGGGAEITSRPKSMPRRSSQSAFHRGPASRGSVASGDGPVSRSRLTSPINPIFYVSSNHARAPALQSPSTTSQHLLNGNLSSPSQQQQLLQHSLPPPPPQQQTLPPFSQLAAAASSNRSDEFYTTTTLHSSSPRHRNHSASRQR